MENKLIMALDQGTTSSRCILFDYYGKTVCKAQREFTQYYPKSGWVEHDPEELWKTQLAVAQEALKISGRSAQDISAIGVTNQRETLIVWDKNTGKPIYNAIVWQCRRTALYCDSMRKQGLEKRVRDKTGLVIDPYFSATKLRWILEHVPQARVRAKQGELLFGTVDTWLIWNLTKGQRHVTDYTNASRTMLFNIHTQKWDAELLEMLDIPVNMLPTPQPSSSMFGTVDSSYFGSPIPITGVAGDQQSALFGHLCCAPGQAKSTYGTGCFLLLHTGEEAVQSKSGLLTTIAASADSAVQYALEGSIFIGGAVMQWLRDELEILESAPESEALARSVPDAGGMYIVPAFAGLGTPHWEAHARGTVVGLTRGAGRAHFARAALESMAYQTLDVLRAMEKDSGKTLTALRVDGGAAENDFLMQFQSDILTLPVLRPANTETTALGAAYLAGLQIGYWRDTQHIGENCEQTVCFTPSMDADKRGKCIAGWRRAVDTALFWARYSPNENT